MQSVRLFVPVATSAAAAVGSSPSTLRPVARCGSVAYLRLTPVARTVSNGVVFTSADNGVMYGFATRDGRLLWHMRLRANVGACPRRSYGDTLLVGSGPALVAFELR